MRGLLEKPCLLRRFDQVPAAAERAPPAGLTEAGRCDASSSSRRTPMSFLRCSAAAAGGSAAALVLHRQEQANTQASQPARPVRVLVTGFHDWRELGDVSPNLWRCRDNPSCRLLLGPTSSAPPVKRDGELPRLLRTDAPEVEFVFQALTCVRNGVVINN